MSFSFDSKSSSALTGDSKSSSGVFSNGTKSTEGITWQTDLLTWVLELRTWAQAASQLSLDTKH